MNPRQQHIERLRNHYGQLAGKREISRKLGTEYQRLLHRYYRLFVPSGQRVLEVGCGLGDLLNALEPARGVGVDLSPATLEIAQKKYSHLHFIEGDAHALPLSEVFDVIILSDLVNDLWDVQQVLGKLVSCCHPGTRLILNFHNNLWNLPLSLARRLGLAHPVPKQNWLTPEDIDGLLNLSGFETVLRRPAILLPLKIPLLAPFCNRMLAHLPFFRGFDLTHFFVARPFTQPPKDQPSVSNVVAARNQARNIETLLQRIPEIGSSSEIIFVEGGSTDHTYETIENLLPRYPKKNVQLLRQTGTGKGDAVRMGFAAAQGEILMILDADGTVAPEDLPRFYDALVSGKGEFINGVRLVYPLGDDSMRFLNMVGNKFFGMLFSGLLGQPIRDTLCGTKVLWKKDYETIARNRAYFGKIDPFGDFDLLFGAARLNLKIQELPIRYHARNYGETNISRWRHGLLLLRMSIRAVLKIKFV